MKFWAPIIQLFRMAFSVRLTTKGRQQISLADIATAQARAEQIQIELDHEREARGESVRALNDATSAHRLEILQAVDRGREAGRQEGVEAGRREIEARIEAEKQAPLTRPSWRLDALQSNVFSLRNTQPGVIVRDLSIEAPMGDFQFNSPTQWPGEFIDVVAFDGDRQHNGKVFGVTFGLRWRDANGDWRTGQVRIDREPRRAIIV